MKTSEFVKRVRNLGFDVVEETTNGLTYCKVYCGFLMAAVSTVEQGVIWLGTTSMDLIKLCIEYAETPLSEREEEKKYIVILPDPNRIGKRVYALGKNLGEVIIRNTQRQGLEDSDMYHLTETEIKRNHEYLWQFAKEVVE